MRLLAPAEALVHILGACQSGGWRLAPRWGREERFSGSGAGARRGGGRQPAGVVADVLMRRVAGDLHRQPLQPGRAAHQAVHLRVERLQLGGVQPRPVPRAAAADAQHPQLRQRRPVQLLGALRQASTSPEADDSQNLGCFAYFVDRNANEERPSWQHVCTG